MRMYRWLVLAELCLSRAALAATACPGFFVDGEAPTLDASLTDRTTEVCHTEYVLMASGVTKGPLYSAEHLTADEVAGSKEISRAGSFHVETAIPAADRSKTTDYTNSGYDRGHMTPAGDPSTVTAEKETFSMANVVPQNPKLNEGEWAKIEAKVRALATQLGDVYVVTGPAFAATDIPTIGADGVAVPEYTWKAVYEPGIGAGAYLCANDSTITCEVVPVKNLTALSGIDVFPGLSSTVKNTAIDLPLP